MPEMTKPRPKFLTLYQIRLPLAGFVSILHRISGAGLFLLLPLLIYTLQSSLDPQPEGVAAFQAIKNNFFVQIFLFGLCWAYLHHFCAGIRYLLLDVHVGVEKAGSHKSAIIVMLVSLSLTALIALKFMGVL
ncbi:MAG: succinate dehydrogenase, cytochrome b556 subunit [Rhodocyclaceae bacterium]|nr:succinate dehydrogenase, cytochrome b556 subunit [Rhodocyclaceae bacterium]MBP6278981.1 succinate dehydrogenase, cytochrome b556 subunit [Rhodocyclaceae bacterium]